MKKKRLLRATILFPPIAVLGIILGAANAQTGTKMDQIEAIREPSLTEESVPYQPPIGIPAPSFGIDETHLMYLGQLYDYDGDGTPEALYKDAGSGPYTHYVDNTNPNCSNSYDFGTADDPLCDLYKGGLSITLPPGSVVEIHGGPYTYQGWQRITTQGTALNPVFVRSVDPVTRILIQGDNDDHDLRIEGSYLILENLEFYNGAFIRIWDGADHISIRYVEIHNPVGETVGWGTALYGGENTQDIVLYQNHIHHNVRGNDADLHGTGTGPGSERIWILENHIHHNSGDAFQACHYCIPAPHDIYVGGNEMHHDRENGVDLKTIHDVIVSENLIYGYEPSATSSGDAVVIGSNGLDPDEGYGPDNAWLIFNEIRDSHRGIRVEGVYNGWILGNSIHDLGTEGIVLDIKAPSENVAIIGNTISSADEGLHHSWRCGVANAVIENNIFDDLTEAHIALEPCVAEVSSLANNLFWNNGGDVSVAWGNLNFQGLDADALNLTVSGTENIIGDPIFASPDTFALGAGSAAIDAGVVSEAYQTFFARYGIDLRKDISGKSRPQGGGWEIGAYEFIPALTLSGIPADQAIHLRWTVNTTLLVTSTWQLNYLGPSGDQPSPITGISSPARSYTLTGVTNYIPYTVTLQAMLAGSPILMDTVAVLPSDRILYMPVVMK